VSCDAEGFLFVGYRHRFMVMAAPDLDHPAYFS
jgi:hypothetical protein